MNYAPCDLEPPSRDATTTPPRPRLEPTVLESAATAAGVEELTLASAVEMALSGGPDEVSPDWWRWAHCRSAETARYYPSRGGRDLGLLLERCRNDCAVQAECLAAALANGEHAGVWGGTSANGRQRLRWVLRDAGVMGVVGEAAYLSWLEEGADLEPVPSAAGVVRRDPWPHQGAAVSSIGESIGDGGRCQISVATGGGKTLIGTWAATTVQADRVLVLVPSLPLIVQGVETWRGDECWADARYLAVCSDAGDSGLEVTTRADDVRAFLAAPGLAVVFATYQSSDVLAAAGVRFDVVVADEAHHLAGERDKAFAAVVRGEISADRVLFMTSTPKRFVRRRADVDLVSMDDAEFGPRVFELSLSDAVAAGVVADYRVVVAAVERDVFDRVARSLDMGSVDPHLLTGAIAVVRAMGEFGLSSCLSFHSRVDRARSFSQLIGPVAEALPALRPAGPGWSGFVHGDTSVRIRRRLLGRLADPRTWGVVANAKSFGEGVDVPVLDAVAIVDPKNSETDVMQATGRALRRPSGGDKVGTVLLPVLTTGDVDAADPLASIDPRGLEVVSGVLRALRSHDSELGSRLDSTRRAAGAHAARHQSNPGLASALRKSAARRLLKSRVELWVPGGAAGDLAGAMALQLVRETTADWEESYGRLVAWTQEHGSARPPQSDPVMASSTSTAFTLGAWCSRQRTLRNRGMLAADRAARLEALAGWEWDLRGQMWWEKFDALADYVRAHGRYPQAKNETEKVLAQFVNGCRTSYTTTRTDDPADRWIHKFPDRIAALESLPAWVWNVREAQWEESFAKLQRFVTLTGHANPDAGNTIDGFDIGKWVAKQRSRIAGTSYFDRRAGRTRQESLSDARIARLRALPGWVEDRRAAMWDEGLGRTVAWANANGGRMPTQDLVLADGFTLGAWCATQRERHRNGRLSKTRTERLNALPFWHWGTGRAKQSTARAAQWRRSFDETMAWAIEHGHCTPASSERSPSGFGLGRWVIEQRLLYCGGALLEERAALLESIPGWAWETRT